MPRLAKFPLKDGGFLAVETNSADVLPDRVMRGSSPGGTVATASDTFEAALGKVRSAAEGILHQLRSLAQPPDSVGVEFGVKMNAETGAIIAKASGEANFKISLSWKKSPGK